MMDALGIFDRPAAESWEQPADSAFHQKQVMAQLEAAHSYACKVMRRHGHRHPTELGGEVFTQKTKRDGQIVNAVTQTEAIEAELILIGINNVMEALEAGGPWAIADAALFLGTASSGPYYRRHQSENKKGKRPAHSVSTDERVGKVYTGLAKHGRAVDYKTLLAACRDAGVALTESQAHRFITNANKARRAQ